MLKIIQIVIIFLFSTNNIYAEDQSVQSFRIGIAEKKIKVKKNPKRLSAKLDFIISKGDSVVIIEDLNASDNYYKISDAWKDGSEGWVLKRFVRVLSEELDLSENGDMVEKRLQNEDSKKLEKEIKKTITEKDVDNYQAKEKKSIHSIDVGAKKDLTKQNNNKNDSSYQKIIDLRKSINRLEEKNRSMHENQLKTRKNNNYKIFFLLISILGISFFSIMMYLNKKEILSKYVPLIKLEEKLKELGHEKVKLLDVIENLKGDYLSKKETFDRLRKEIAILDEELMHMDFGIYKPKFDFGTSSDYKNKINDIVDKQKKLVKDAIYSSVDVYILDNKTAGNKMINTYKKIAMRCFNNETSTISKKVNWKLENVLQAEQKIQKSYKAVNDFLSSLKMYIRKDYLDLKIEELNARHEYSVILNQEREKIREENSKIREEERAQKEFEDARIKAEKDQKIFQQALDKAKKELGLLSQDEAKKLEQQISALKSKLEEAKKKGERAKSMAQMTKVGYVYIISNIGSFGEQVYKIGLTRRLVPMDRVKELGDASVPFAFDVHAMIYSENAPELESALHKVFNNKRVNLVNRRKEYFRVNIDEIEREVHKIDESVSFIRISEAIEYNQTLKILNDQLEKETIELESQFPDSI
ncbi:DUF4041 domain-containing protein [Candidatus Marinimicrobia bacterium]|nr:DUF4041 domain-containing protein [Candidatus Neomarinimicrobiota bacterium]